MLENHLENTLPTFLGKFLDNHKILPNMRAKMVDWIIEVINSYNFSEQTQFLSINIMD